MNWRGWLVCPIVGHIGDDSGLDLERHPRPEHVNVCYRGTCARCGVRGYVFVPRKWFPGEPPRHLKRAPDRDD
jgi:hypothetical protein